MPTGEARSAGSTNVVAPRTNAPRRTTKMSQGHHVKSLGVVVLDAVIAYRCLRRESR
jgi:hypothetical protein